EAPARARGARRERTGGAHPGPVRARAGIPRVPRRAGRPAGRARPPDRVGRGATAGRGRRPRALAPTRLRPEGLGRGMSAPMIYVTGSDDYYLARILALPGCNATGRTRDDAGAHARRAFRASRGRPGA